MENNKSKTTKTLDKVVNYIFKDGLSWCYSFLIMYCVFNFVLLVFYILLIPNLSWLVSELNPIGLICSVFGGFLVALYLALKTAYLLTDLDRLIKGLGELKLNE